MGLFSKVIWRHISLFIINPLTQMYAPKYTILCIEIYYCVCLVFICFHGVSFWELGVERTPRATSEFSSIKTGPRAPFNMIEYIYELRCKPGLVIYVNSLHFITQSQRVSSITVTSCFFSRKIERESSFLAPSVVPDAYQTGQYGRRCYR